MYLSLCLPHLLKKVYVSTSLQRFLVDNTKNLVCKGIKYYTNLEFFHIQRHYDIIHEKNDSQHMTLNKEKKEQMLKSSRDQIKRGVRPKFALLS